MSLGGWFTKIIAQSFQPYLLTSKFPIRVSKLWGGGGGGGAHVSHFYYTSLRGSSPAIAESSRVLISNVKTSYD